MNSQGCRNQGNSYPNCRTSCRPSTPCNPCISYNPCSPCPPCPPSNVKQSCSSKGDFLCVTTTSSKDCTTRPRPSSAGSTNGKKSLSSLSKSTSSDSKVIGDKKKYPTKTKKPDSKNNANAKLDAASIQQLKEDLDIIKKQLIFLTQNRNEALELNNELQGRYDGLLKTNQKLENEIEELKKTNRELLNKVNSQRNGKGACIEEAVETKKTLDCYKSKLSTLYSELISSSQAMEESRNKMCQCIKKKEDEFKEILTSTQQLSKSLEEKNYTCQELMIKYQESKENELKLFQEKNQLKCCVKQLEERLNTSMKELNMLRNDVTCAKRTPERKTNSNQCTACQINLKSREIDELNATVEELQRRLCVCSQQTENGQKIETDYQNLLKEHEEALQKIRKYEAVHNQRFQEIQKLKRNEKKLTAEINHLQNYSNDLVKLSNAQRLKIAELEGVNQEADSIVQCLTADMASKEKKINILLKNEDRLKKRTIQLQEELVSMKIGNNHLQQNNVLTADDCPVHLTEELQDLITTLYEEVDNNMSKDEYIQQQNRRICYLECTLCDKNQELNSVHQELKMIQKRLKATFGEKEAQAEYESPGNPGNQGLCNEEFCEC